jgi:DnaK suppressor protein
MPEEKKMEAKKVETFRKILLSIKENLVHDIHNMSQHPNPQGNDAGDVSGHVLHMADVATDMYDREFALGLASNDREILTHIEQALSRIDKKTFGLCTECSKPIKQARLDAIPYVATCVKCQEALENKK